MGDFLEDVYVVCEVDLVNVVWVGYGGGLGKVVEWCLGFVLFWYEGEVRM